MWPFACRFRWRLLTRDGPRSACAPQVVTGEVRGAGCAAPASLTFFGEDGACLPAHAYRAAQGRLLFQAPLPSPPLAALTLRAHTHLLFPYPRRERRAGAQPRRRGRLLARLRQARVFPAGTPAGLVTHRAHPTARRAPSTGRPARRMVPRGGARPCSSRTQRSLSDARARLSHISTRCGCFGPPRDTRTASPVGGGWALRTRPAAAFPGSRRLTWYAEEAPLSRRRRRRRRGRCPGRSRCARVPLRCLIRTRCARGRAA